MARDSRNSGSLRFVPKAGTPDLAVKLRDWAEDLPNRLELSSPKFRNPWADGQTLPEYPPPVRIELTAIRV